MAKHSVLVVDDHPIFRKGVIDILNELEDIEVIGAASNGMDAYKIILSKRPHLVIADLEMPILNGLELAAKVLSEKHQTKFILLTMHNEKHYFDDAMRCGVMGYLLKDNAVDELKYCIEAVMDDRNYVSDSLRRFLNVGGGEDSTQVPHEKPLKLLSPTERVIIKLISDGFTSAEIASKLFISTNTVDNHRANIARKLGLEGKNSLLKFAMQNKGNL